MKNLTLKSLVVAAGFAIASLSANAAVTVSADLNPSPDAEHYSYSSDIVGTSFSDYISLSFLGSRDLVGSLSGTSTKNITFTSFDLLAADKTTVLTYGFLGSAGPRLAFGGLESINGLGNYFVHIAGTSVGSASYNGTLSLTSLPVPEPETYGMMLAGLGLMGFMARRRKIG